MASAMPNSMDKSRMALSSFLALTMPENDFEDVIECNTYLEAILLLSMLFGMAEALTIPQNAFGDVIECNTYLEAILHLSMLFGMAEALTIPQNAFEAVDWLLNK